MAWLEAFTSLWNVTGDPALSLPLCRSASSRTLGIQLVAPLGHDDRLVRLGSWLETAIPWHDRLPPIHLSALT